MHKKIIFCLIVTFILSGSAVLTAEILAQETSGAENIQYPIKELGNCQNKLSCKTYCDKPENMEVCLDFAEKNNLMSKEEVATAKKFIAAGDKKPGGCTTKDSCEEYCNDISRIDECLAFAIENNLVPPKELDEVKKVQAAIKKGIKPPACGNKKACDVYCESPEHMEECINFAMEAGFMSEQEKADSQKMLAAVKRGVKPPPCKGKEECDEYCSEPDNMETCMTFAIEAGFMSEQEKADSQKMLVALKKGVKPPNCRGKEECDVYCQQDEHFKECLNFAEAAGFMSAEEAAMSRKTGGKGPGGCKGKEGCEAFCNNPDNQETCFNFGKEHGLIPEEDLKRMEEGKQQFKQSLEQAPQEILDCLNSQLGSDMMEKLKTGAVMPPREIGESMRSCFEKMRPMPGQGGPAGEGMMPPGQTGPGGCQTPEECQSFCAANPQECQNFKAPMPPSSNPSGQNGPARGPGPGNGMGISNEQLEELMRIQPVCDNPEQCQQMQQQIEQQIQQVQQQMQNQMAPPQPCEGGTCNYGPPPNQSGGQAPQPSTGGYPSQITPPPPNGSTPNAGSSMPTGPYPNQPQPTQQPQQYQPPQPTQQYQQYQQPPQQPIPGETTPPPSGFLAPKTFLGSIVSIFNQTLHAEK